MKPKTRELSPTHKRVFGIITLIIPIIFIVLLELMLRLFGYGESYKLFVEVPDETLSNYYTSNGDIGKKYFNRFEYTSPPKDVFKKEKPENGFRIFVLGSSTVAGFPYGHNLLFSRILHDRLQALYPEREIEVVNTALTAINSYTLRDFTKQILNYDPDAILIYAGQNEFYGAMGAGSSEGVSAPHSLTHLHLSLLNYRTYQLISNIIGSVASVAAKKPEDVRGTLMSRIASNRDIEYGSRVYRRGIKQYERNMGSILSKAERRGVHVYISEVVSNVRDLPPFSSPKTPGQPIAMDVYKEAREKEANGEIDAARQLYYKAKDLDGVRFRASEDINDLIRLLGAKHNAHVVPMQRHFEQNSKNGIIGNSLMTEHVHPNIEGYFIMANAFYATIAESNAIGPFSRINHIDMAYHMRHWGYTELDKLVGYHRVTNLMHHWPFRPLDAPYVDYRQIYKPTSHIDSVAFNVMRSTDVSFYDAHLYFANLYEANKEYYKAYREFLALVKIVPYDIDSYIGAINNLIRINDYPTAWGLVNQMLEIEPSFHGFFYKGEFELNQFNYKAAIEAYEKASEYVKNPSQWYTLLTKKYIALHLDGQNQAANQVIQEIRRRNPDFMPIIPDQPKGLVFFIPNYIEKDVLNALALYHAQEFDQALELMRRTLAIKETPIGNRTVGEILLRRSDPNAIIYLSRAKKYYDDNVPFLHNLSLCYARAGMIEDARTSIKQIERVAPNYQQLPTLKALINRLETEGSE